LPAKYCTLYDTILIPLFSVLFPINCTYLFINPQPKTTVTNEKSIYFGLIINHKTTNNIFAATKKGKERPKNEGIQNLSGGI
jgi:hypothetical protein